MRNAQVDIIDLAGARYVQLTPEVVSYQADDDLQIDLENLRRELLYCVANRHCRMRRGLGTYEYDPGEIQRQISVEKTV
jgi:hypothetical protein